ncbi:hypothetical protein EIP91_001137 [Steccherinum ochraceum]|uniref:Protein kinase domain-containing protein n=1 Tax=Steccherinum ochraceum TaxID=92696 RepID=A0A4R0REF4_9APHY|nr:hypothetical protein EIP91_001137 [Steccherinum ochraceum]
MEGAYPYPTPSLDPRLLDSPPTPCYIVRLPNYKLRQLVLKLAITHGVLPSSLLICGVEREDDEHRVEGGFAAIFYGKLGGEAVAIKRLSVFLKTTGAVRAQLKQAFYRECILWKGLVHTHVLPFLGVSEDVFRNTICIILPWMDNGRIRDYIDKLRSNGELRDAEFPDAIHRWLRQIALGLQYLHEEKVVHGDLHGGNILVDACGDVKLTDFGMSVAADGTPYNYGSTHGGGAVRWTAPELIEPEEFGFPNRRPTVQSDVYSFACICVELYSLQPPWVELQREYQVISKVVHGGRPPRPKLPDGKDVSDNVWSIVTSCWSHKPRDRPSTTTIVQELDAIATSRPTPVSSESLALVRREKNFLAPVPLALESDTISDAWDILHHGTTTLSSSLPPFTLDVAGPEDALQKRLSSPKWGWISVPKVLVVDDDAVCRKLTSKWLQVFGCTTADVAVDGVEAVNMANVGKYDLVLMDIALDKLDGVSATHLIRAFDKNTPIVAVTGNMEIPEIRRYYANSMNDILPKPVKREDLLDILEKHLSHLRKTVVSPTLSENQQPTKAPPDAGYTAVLQQMIAGSRIVNEGSKAQTVVSRPLKRTLENPLGDDGKRRRVGPVGA